MASENNNLWVVSASASTGFNKTVNVECFMRSKHCPRGNFPFQADHSNLRIKFALKTCMKSISSPIDCGFTS